MTGRPAARGSRRRRAGRAHRRRPRPGARPPGSRGGHLGPPGGRGRRRGAGRAARGHRAGRAADRRRGGRRRGDPARAPPADRARAVHRLRTGRARARPLQLGQIYESNGPMLAAAVEDAGGVADLLRFVPDDVAHLHRVLDDRLAAGTVDLVLTSGGISAGAYEVVKEALARPGRRVRQGRDAAGRAPGRGTGRRRRGRRAARQPRQLARVVRGVRAPGAAGGPRATRTRSGRGSPPPWRRALTSTAGPASVPPRRGRRRRGNRPGGRRTTVAPARSAGAGRLLLRRARRRSPSWPPAHRSRCGSSKADVTGITSEVLQRSRIAGASNSVRSADRAHRRVPLPVTWTIRRTLGDTCGAGRVIGPHAKDLPPVAGERTSGSWPGSLSRGMAAPALCVLGHGAGRVPRRRPGPSRRARRRTGGRRPRAGRRARWRSVGRRIRGSTGPPQP